MAYSQKNRLKSGGRIDRSKPLSFNFNGKTLEGYQGDTIASALLANGVGTVNRSFKFHRRRGIMSAGVEETNALLTASDIPAVRTTIRALEEGQHIKSPIGYPSVDFDLGRMLDFSHMLWPAGFYNKIFKWPNWHTYEGLVRKMAGLGHVPKGKDNNRYFHHNLYTDMLIVGAGPAGLEAALTAANSGERVLLVEQDFELGGYLLSGSENNWLRQTHETLEAAQNVTIMTSSTVTAYYDYNVLTITDRRSENVKRFWKIRAKKVLLATGAIEQPLIFENNDRPGIMLAGAAMEYINRYAVRPASVMAVATNNDSAYKTAFDLHDNGVAVPAIIDARKNIPATLKEQSVERGIEIRSGSVVLNSFGAKRISKIRIATLSDDAKSLTGEPVDIACDGLALSGGFNPTCHLYSQAGGKLLYDPELGCFVPKSCAQNVTVISEAESHNIEPIRITPAGNSSRQWIDFMHDVTVADIELAVRENFVSVEHLKRHTTTGMSADQGKTSNLNALTLLAELTNRPIEEVGTTTFRPQFMPVPMGAIAGQTHGDFYAPARLLPSHDWHASEGAVFENYGSWKRPEYYAVGERNRETAIAEEMLSLRRSAGLFDGSPLGKIEVKGPDAGEFLHRMYVNNVLSLKPGRVRYGIMLNENGIVMDDGVFARLAEDLYLVNTTSANSDRIAAWFEEWYQCEWPELEVLITPVTSQWGVTTLAGPNARELLQELHSDIDFSADAMPHMSIATGTLMGRQARVQRVSYSGELSFEISVPASDNQHIIDALMSLPGKRITPIGVEATLLLRVEKGYLHVGADTDGMTNALDVGFGGIVAKKKSEFVGKRSLLRSADQKQDRRQFVGIEPINSDADLQPGAHFITEDAKKRSQGIVTSACYSPILERVIGLGLLEGGFKRKGEIVTIYDDGIRSQVRIVDADFYDPTGEKMNG